MGAAFAAHGLPRGIQREVIRLDAPDVGGNGLRIMPASMGRRTRVRGRLSGCPLDPGFVRPLYRNHDRGTPIRLAGVSHMRRHAVRMARNRPYGMVVVRPERLESAGTPSLLALANPADHIRSRRYLHRQSSPHGGERRRSHGREFNGNSLNPPLTQKIHGGYPLARYQRTPPIDEIHGNGVHVPGEKRLPARILLLRYVAGRSLHPWDKGSPHTGQRKRDGDDRRKIVFSAVYRAPATHWP